MEEADEEQGIPRVQEQERQEERKKKKSCGAWIGEQFSSCMLRGFLNPNGNG
jgi:hypothetical protein